MALKQLQINLILGETRKHKIEINLMDEDGKRIGTVGAEIELQKNPNLSSGWRQGFLSVINLNQLTFKKFGDYNFELVVNNTSLKSIPIRVAEHVQIQAS